jgi:hypothetical protein
LTQVTPKRFGEFWQLWKENEEEEEEDGGSDRDAVVVPGGDQPR